MVEKILEETSMPINCLEIEITESLFAQDMGKVSHILEALHDKRVGVSVDDFGTGYSSLSRPLSSQAIEAILKKGDKKIKFPQEKG
ncbi:MAG TPA: EAL domain-containing protein [Desulfobacter postgatei]|jgi:EAL domain-containing protein (putative c-di-GMP-specific phosphodiesterase class I)|nr:EAL domain-containing protein [Desulfobacter postgatei]